MMEISIHALLAESDKPGERHASSQQEFLSTLSLRRATVKFSVSGSVISDFYPRSPCGERRESQPLSARPTTDFYPRSPCGERRSLRQLQSALHDFYPRSPCGERLIREPTTSRDDKFLSTLSLRRATINGISLIIHIS